MKPNETLPAAGQTIGGSTSPPSSDTALLDHLLGPSHHEKRNAILARAEQREHARKQKMTGALAGLTQQAMALNRDVNEPGDICSALARQASLLDTMFWSVMQCYTEGDYDDPINNAPGHAPLEFAMRIQKQCVETLRALGSIHYMNSIAPPPPVMWEHPPLDPPSAPFPDERTGER